MPAASRALALALALRLRDDIVMAYGNYLPSATACLDDDFEACVAHLTFRLTLR